MTDAHNQPVIEDRAQGQADKISRRHDTDHGRRLAHCVQAQGGQRGKHAVADTDDKQPK